MRWPTQIFLNADFVLSINMAIFKNLELYKFKWKKFAIEKNTKERAFHYYHQSLYFLMLV